MADGDLSAGVLHADVVPDLSRFGARLRKRLPREGARAGRELGRSIAEAAVRPITLGLVSAVRVSAARVTAEAAKVGRTAGAAFAREFAAQAGKTPAGPSRERARRQGREAGRESGGAFADGFRRRVDAALKALPKVTIGVARNEAEQQVKDLAARLEALSSKRIGVDVDAATAVAEVRRIEAALNDLARTSPDIQVQADTAAASAQLARVREQADALDRKVEVDVNVDTDQATRAITGVAGLIGQTMASIQESVARIGSGVGSAAAQFAALTAGSGGLNLLVGVLLAAVAAVVAFSAALVFLAPLLLSIGGLAGAAVASLAGLGAVAGVLGLGLSGIGDAFTAMGEAQKSAGRDAAQAASREASLASALDGVRNAQQGVIAAREQAAEGARQTARRVVDAERELIDAQRDALVVQQELTRAREAARREMEDLASQVRGNALDQRQAVLDVAEARRELDEVLGNPRSTREQQEAARIRYEREKLQQEDLKRRGERLRKDEKAAIKAGIEGSEQVRAVKERIVAANERIRRSEDALSEARRQQTRQAVQGARQVEQAQQALIAAQRSLYVATVQTSSAGSAAMQKLDEAMAALSPNARKLVKELDRLRGPFGELKRFVQDRLLEGVAEQIRQLANRWIPALYPVLGRLADRFNRVFNGIVDALTEQSFIDNISIAIEGFGRMFDRIGQSIPGVIDAFGRIAAASTPVLEKIGELIGGILDKFAAWIRTADETGDLDRFMRDAADALGEIAGLVKEILGLVGDVIAIFFPVSNKNYKTSFGYLRDDIKWVREWLQDPENQQKVRDFTQSIIDMGKEVKDFVNRVRDEWIPQIEDWIDRIDGWMTRAEDWGRRIQLVGTLLAAPFTASATAVSFALDRIEGDWNGTMGVLASGWIWVQNHVFKPLGLFVIQTIPNWFSTARDWVTGHWAGMGDGLAAVWHWVRDHVFQPLRNAVVNGIPDAFRAGVEAIETAWHGLQDAARNPVRFVVETILNPLITGYNNIAGAFGAPRVPNIEMRFASGGIMPGYTPGRDVHRFVSPTGGVLDLSGGEPILRPEAGRVLGAGWVHGINAAARTGGTAGVRRFLGAGHQQFDGGGFWEGSGDRLVRARAQAGALVGGLSSFPLDPGGSIRRLGGQLAALLPATPDLSTMLAGMTRKLAGVLADRLDEVFEFGGATGVFKEWGKFGGGWPPSPADQRGDSGVWRAIHAMVRASGIPHSFGNAYRHGDPLWHGSGRAIDYMGYNQDRLAQYFMAMRPRVLELIHTTDSGGYYITRGQRVASMGIQDELHRNHLHIAMASGGILPALAGVPTLYDQGGYIPPGISLVANATGRPEPVLTDQQWQAMMAATRAGDGPREVHNWHGVSERIDQQFLARWQAKRDALARVNRTNR